VGGFYGKYEAQNFAKSFHDLGIEILSMGGPYYCSKCKTVVTEFSCSHGENYSHNISGTEMRELFRNGQIPSDDFMRNEVSHKLLEIAREGKLFY